MPRNPPQTGPDQELLKKIGRFPAGPGVYILKDASSRILYIGKAVNLRSRVRSYFGKTSDTRVFHEFLVGRIADADCIVTESEAEALILENNLIKKHRPVYNIRLKDDKTYVSLKVTTQEDWPRVLVVRRYRDDGNLYFGPYGSASSVREMLRVVNTVFPLRTCTNAFFASRKRPCIEHEIGRCTAPCVDIITREKYLEDVNEVVLFLRGRNKELVKVLERKMKEAAAARSYELAARYRDQIRAIEKVFEAQKAKVWGRGDLDVFAAVREGEAIAVQELLVRDGRIVTSECHSYRTTLDTGEVLASFLSQYYLAERYIPLEVLLSEDFPDRALLEEWLGERRGKKVSLDVPQRGEKARLVELAARNCRNMFLVTRTEEERREALTASLQAKLGLVKAPRRIECFDISSFQGSLAVGAAVRFEDGLPVKSRYRKFRIQTVVGADDFRCLEEVLGRRLSRGIEEGDLPDLIVVDGGKGQLGAALEVVRRLGVEAALAVVGLAKERRHRGTTERVFVPGRRDPLPLPQDAAESLYLQRLRDEAHRFAVRYHRELRKKETLRTGLEGIPGIGRKRRAELLERFGTLKGLRGAREEEIAAVVGEKLARTIQEKLGKSPDRESV
jgi:excinuclease ABC subunit C